VVLAEEAAEEVAAGDLLLQARVVEAAVVLEDQP
jgi:hypothetical protein